MPETSLAGGKQPRVTLAARCRLPCACAAALVLAGTLEAREISVTVMDHKNRPVEDVVVYAEPNGARPAGPESPGSALGPAQGSAAGSARAPARMDQINSQFVPHVLVVEAGSEVEFPNNDLVSHHVYSFSETRPFELGLYRGSIHPPIAFESPGLVVLGCNIHDNMLGYILVVDTPHFARTNDAGVAYLDSLPIGHYSVRVWTPRVDQKELPAPVEVDLDDADAAFLDFRFTERLHPPHGEHGDALTWEYH